MKTKFSAGELKKKLFGGVMTMMQQQQQPAAAASATQRSNVIDNNYNDILNRSINSPPPFQNAQTIEASHNGILNTTGGLGEIGKMEGDDLFYSMDDTHSRKIKDKRQSGALQ